MGGQKESGPSVTSVLDLRRTMQAEIDVLKGQEEGPSATLLKWAIEYFGYEE